MDIDKGSDKTLDILVHWIAVHACLKTCLYIYNMYIKVFQTVRLKHKKVHTDIKL